jgi:hypothetical protein
MIRTSLRGSIVLTLLVAVASTTHAQLTLEVRLPTLEASIVNKTALNYPVDALLIQSPSGGLDPNNWLSLADQGITGWLEANPTNFDLTEFNLTSFTLWEPGTRFGIGNPLGLPDNQFNSLTQDVTFQYALTSGGLENGIVEYIQVPEPAAAAVGITAGLVAAAFRRAPRR